MKNNAEFVQLHSHNNAAERPLAALRLVVKFNLNPNLNLSPNSDAHFPLPSSALARASYQLELNERVGKWKEFSNWPAIREWE